MREISRSVVKADHEAKVSGRALYVSDRPGEGVLCGKIVHSERAHARLAGIHVPALPAGYFAAGREDVPGDNNVAIVLDDCPVFARETVEYVGEAILMIAGPEERKVDELVRAVRIDYEDLPPVLDMDEARETFFSYSYAKGEGEAAFAQADRVFAEEFRTGYQEQGYLETQALEASWDDGGKVTVRGSLQCPYYVYNALKRALAVDDAHVRVIHDVTGGGFGGKEDYPSILACQVATAAKKAGAPVRCVFTRREDMAFTSKRHPSHTRCRAAVKDGRVTALDMDITLNGGAYTTLSAVVLQRAIIAAMGVYNIPNLTVHGRAVKTNTVPCGAYRGFGGPQAFFAVEMLMGHVAAALGKDSLSFRLAHLAQQGDPTSTGGVYHFPVPLPEMVKEVCARSDYRKKHALYAKKQTGRFRRGIGLSMVFHGAGFTGSGERDLIKACVRLHKSADGRVEVLAANADIGQGVLTTFPKIVACELDIPLERVTYVNPDTDRVPDSGPTVASRSLMTVGELLRRAAVRLRSEWREGEEQEVEERYREPDFLLPFDISTFHGDAYPTFAWSVQAVETETDAFTGRIRIVGAWGSFDLGTPIDESICVGQMEGGFLQGLGWSSQESLNCDGRGRLRGASFTDYLMPTAMDVPELHAWLHVQEYPDGPYGAKGAGELPLVGSAPAFAAAMEEALRAPVRHVPFTQEDALAALEGGDGQ